MAPQTGVLEWKDTGSLGRTGRSDEEVVSPTMSVYGHTYTGVYGALPGMDEELTEKVLKGKQGQVAL